MFESVRTNEERIPESADEALNMARTIDGATYNDLKDEGNKRFLAGCAWMYEQALNADLTDPEAEDLLIGETLAKLVAEIRGQVKREMLNGMLYEIEEALESLADAEAEAEENGEG